MSNKVKAKFINDIKKAYITPLSILIIDVMIILNAIAINSSIDTIQELFYYIVFLMVIVIISIIKENMKNVYYTKKVELVYLIITILASYILPLLVSSYFMLGLMMQGLNVVGYWLIIIVLTFLSFLAVHIFVVREFRLTSRFDNILVRNYAMLLQLASTIGLIYMSLIVPSIVEENRLACIIYYL